MKRLRGAAAFMAGFWLLIVLGVLGAADGDRVYLPVVLRPGVAVPPATVTPQFTATSTAPAATMTPQFTPTSTVPAATVTATATRQPPGGCSICSYDAYNCSDFSTQAAAQSCFDYCMALVGYDVHRLDADNNGVACESLPLVFGEWVFVWP